MDGTGVLANYDTRTFYRAIRGYATVCCPSVRLSVTFRHFFHTGLNTSKISSRPISLRFLFGLAPTSTIWSNGTPPKVGWNKGGVESWAENVQCLWNGTRQDQGYYEGLIIKPWPDFLRLSIALSTYTENRSRTYTRFRLVPKSMTSDDLEWPIRTLAEKMRFTEPTRKNEWR